MILNLKNIISVPSCKILICPLADGGIIF